MSKKLLNRQKDPAPITQTEPVGMHTPITVEPQVSEPVESESSGAAPSTPPAERPLFFDPPPAPIEFAPEPPTSGETSVPIAGPCSAAGLQGVREAETRCPIEVRLTGTGALFLGPEANRAYTRPEALGLAYAILDLFEEG